MSKKKETKSVKSIKMTLEEFKEIMAPTEERPGPCGGCDLIPTPPRHRVR